MKSKIFIITFELITFLILFFSVYQMYALNTTLYEQSKNKIQMIEVADKLRQSSDDLTHFARTYAVTNNKLYYKQYIDTLDIRNGKIPRPIMYDNIYWDLEKNIRLLRHPDGEKVALKKLIEQLPFTQDETEKLKLSEASSNDLVNLEIEAFDAMAQVPPNQKLAIELLHSQEYYNAKHNIMNPIDEFMMMLDERTQNNSKDIEEKIAQNFILFLITAFIFMIGNFIVFKFIKKSLHDIIDMEVEKNNKQQVVMFEQSRLALIGNMISMLAHQWRQPLATISMNANNILADVEFNNYDEKNLVHTQENIINISKNLSKTIDDFSNIYKPDEKPVTTKIDDTILKALNIIKQSLIDDNIEIIEEYNSKEEIELYDSEIVQVILNSLKNAQENFKKKQIKEPYIKITTKNNKISICDNGGGIPEDIIDEIFDPYFSTKNEKNAKGLGLYMSKMIIEEHHNGKLSTENTDDGVCFRIELGRGIK